MHDYRKIDSVSALIDDAVEMYEKYIEILQDLAIDREKAIDEIKRGYSTSTEIADTLFREGGVPFRHAHAYVSRLIDVARAENVALFELPDEVWHREYHKMFEADLPVNVDRLHFLSSPEAFVANRRGLGGPQEIEMIQRIIEQKQNLEMQRKHVQGVRIGLGERRFELYQTLDSIRDSE